MAILTRSERFKDARLNHNQHGKQTMKAVEQAAGVSASLIKDLESDNSNRSVGYDKVAALAKHYGVSSDWLLSLTDDPASNPCATDDLGLFPSVVRKICKSWSEDKQEQQDWLEGEGSIPVGWISGHTALNMLLDSPLMEIVFAKIAIARSKINTYHEMQIPADWKHLEQHRIEEGEHIYNYFVSRNIEHDLFDTHPEFAPFIHVSFGSDSLKMDIDEICDGFRLCVEEITGYKKFMEQLDSKKG